MIQIAKALRKPTKLTIRAHSRRRSGTSNTILGLPLVARHGDPCKQVFAHTD
jgi:hypothetical protein